MQKIDFMAKKKYVKDKNDIKLLIIAPNGDILLTSKKYDNKLMKKDLNIPYYNDNDKCYYHADNIQVLLNNYFIDKPDYQKYRTRINPDNNAIITFNVIHKLLEDGYIVFYNNTSYDGIYYQLHGTHGTLYINYPTLTEEQEQSLKEIEQELETFKEINIEKNIDHAKNYVINYTTTYDQIYNTLFNNKGRSK